MGVHHVDVQPVGAGAIIDRPDRGGFGGEVREWVDEMGRFKVAQVGYNSVVAVPHDMFISGYDSDASNRLILWSAKLPQSRDKIVSQTSASTGCFFINSFMGISFIPDNK